MQAETGIGQGTVVPVEDGQEPLGWRADLRHRRKRPRLQYRGRWRG